MHRTETVFETLVWQNLVDVICSECFEQYWSNLETPFSIQLIHSLAFFSHMWNKILSSYGPHFSKSEIVVSAKRYKEVTALS